MAGGDRLKGVPLLSDIQTVLSVPRATPRGDFHRFWLRRGRFELEAFAAYRL